MNREKLVKKLAKAIAKSDNEYEFPQCDPIRWSEESDHDREAYTLQADAALKELARLINKTPEVPWGDHSIDAVFVDYLAGELDEYAPLDER